jgi:eukaryotic translation initiation factor 2C
MVSRKVCIAPSFTQCSIRRTHRPIGQFHQVLEQELPKIREACAAVPGGRCNPKISVIIVGKRHHTRFYPTDDNAADGKTGNPTPGTVVDRCVTAVYDFDFYLQAHAGIKGTARPAHYYVIHDENKFSADALQSVVCTCPSAADNTN